LPSLPNEQSGKHVGPNPGPEIFNAWNFYYDYAPRPILNAVKVNKYYIKVTNLISYSCIFILDNDQIMTGLI
jgi:hypothetical protein